MNTKSTTPPHTKIAYLLDMSGSMYPHTEAAITGFNDFFREQQEVEGFAIFTDGMENASRKYTWQDIAARIQKRQKKDGWEFLFLAAGQDAIATAAQMNIHAHSAATVDSENKFMARDSGRAMARKVRAMRSQELHRADFAAPMEEILRDEERRDAE